MNCNIQQLNITCGTDVVLHDRLVFDGETFDPALSVGITANLVSSLGKRTALEVEVADGALIITIPWVDGRTAGYYGLEVTGSCNHKKWATYADSLIHYTRATEMGAVEVEMESDYYDITQVVAYRYSTSPIDSVTVTVDGNVGTPSGDAEYDGHTLAFDFSNLKGNGIASITTTESTEDGGTNTVTITDDLDNETAFSVKNGRRGNGIASFEQTAESTADEGVNTWTLSETDGEVTEMSLKNGSRGNGIASVVQTTTSSESGGENIVTITDTDGHVTEVSIHNGTQGDSAVFDPSDPNPPDFVMANTTGQSTTKAMTQKAVTDAIKAQLETVDTSSADLEISDENGNVLVSFSEGHVETKNFDSRDMGKLDVGDADRDLNISDEQGYIIASFSDGHIQTKNFDSRDLGRLEQIVHDALTEEGDTYYGEKISLVRHKYNHSLLFTESDGGQGACCYGGYLFQFFNTNNKIDIYNMSTKSKVQQITLTAVETYHCNNANFGNEFYDSGDEFPLLYVSMENAAEHKCLVYRVTVTGGIFAVTLVQTITFPAPSNDFLYYPNAFIDCDRSKMLVVGLGNNPWSSGTDNILVFKTFPLPTLSDGDTTLDIADLEDSFTAYNYPTPQGGFIANGKLYQVLGGTTNARMIAVDLRGHKVVSEIDLMGNGLAIEPEGCFEHDGSIHINFVNGKIYKLKF